MLKLIGLIATLGAGFGLGRAKLRVHVRMAILTAMLAAVAQMSLKLALPHDVIEQTAQSHLYTATGQIVLMALAIVESAGLLFPVALMPWANRSSRAWATLYVLGAAVLAAATYYFPFDVVIMNGEVIGPKHAPYGSGSSSVCPLVPSVIWSDGSNGEAARGRMRHLPPNRRHPAEAATAHGGG